MNFRFLTHHKPAIANSSVNYEACQQLIRVLAHHMAHIAEHLNLMHGECDKSKLIRGAPKQWDNELSLRWVGRETSPKVLFTLYNFETVGANYNLLRNGLSLLKSITELIVGASQAIWREDLSITRHY